MPPWLTTPAWSTSTPSPICRGGRLRKAASARALRADVLRALAWFELGRLDQAVDLIGDVLQRAQENGYRRLFLDEGARMAALLRETLKRSGPRSSAIAAFLHELLASFSDVTNADERDRLLGASHAA